MTNPLLIPVHPVGFGVEIAAMPTAYRGIIGDMTANIRDFYSREISALGGTPPGVDETLDTHARALLETRFPHHGDYYGYFRANDRTGHPTGAYVRMVGLLPAGREKVRGTILDIRGYGHVFEHDLERTADFLDAGFAVFTPDRMEHGLSSRIDPRNAAFRSTRIFVEHTRQALEIADGIRRDSTRLASAPLYAIGSSLGGAQILAAMKAAASPLGIQALALDSPLLTFGAKYSWLMRRATAGLFGALAAFPARLSEVGAFYPKRSAPVRFPGMTDALFDRITRYFRAFGPRYHPIAMNDMEDLIFGNQRWLRSGAADRLPRLLMTVSPSDTELNPVENLSLFRKFARVGDRLRHTTFHNAFVQRDDARLVPDVIDFFEGRV